MAELPAERIFTGPGEEKLIRYQGAAAPQGSDGVRNAPHSAQGSKLPPTGRPLTRFAHYHLLAILGEGTYGVVVKCIRLTDMKTVAVKIVKNEYFRNGLVNMEVAALQKLKMHNSHKYNLVQFNRVLTNRQHVYLEFELLDKSLFELMKERHFQPLGLKSIRPIVQQIARALNHMKSVGIIHADLKLENVMLVNHQQEPYRVKVIDFSLACDVSSAKVGSRIQSRSYRSPEIILGAPFTEAIDVWSLGCIAANLFLGSLLYPGSNEYEVMRYIVETQGQPPGKLLDCGLKTASFFYPELDFTTNMWKLKTPEQFASESGTAFTEKRRIKLTSLDDLKHYWVISHRKFADIAAEMCDLLMFVEILKGMLALDPEKRMTPSQVLEHDFTRMVHITCLYHYSSHVKSCFQKMAICQMVTSNSRAALCGSLQQPCSRTSQPAQQSPPHPPTERGTSTEPHCPSSSTSQPAQENHPQPSAEHGTLTEPHCPSSNTSQPAQENHPQPSAEHGTLTEPHCSSSNTSKPSQQCPPCPPAEHGTSTEPHCPSSSTSQPAQENHPQPSAEHGTLTEPHCPSSNTSQPAQENHPRPPAEHGTSTEPHCPSSNISKPAQQCPPHRPAERGTRVRCHRPYSRTTCPAQQYRPHPPVERHCLYFRTTHSGQKYRLRPPAVCLYLYFRTTRPGQKYCPCLPAVHLYLDFRTTHSALQGHPHPPAVRLYLYFRTTRPGQKYRLRPPAVCLYLYFRTTRPGQKYRLRPLAVRLYLYFRTTRPGQKYCLRPPAVHLYLYCRTTCTAQQCHPCPPAERHRLYFRSTRPAQRLNREPLRMDEYY